VKMHPLDPIGLLWSCRSRALCRRT